MTILMNTAAIVLAIATIIPISRRTHWYIRCWDFPRLQLLALIGLWLSVALVMSYAGSNVSWAFIALMVTCLIYQAWWIIPYSPLFRTEVDRVDENHDFAELTLLISNVLMDNRHPDALLGLIQKHEPDILATLESDSWWQAQLDTLEHYPYRIAYPLDNRYGMHVYSQIPLLEKRVEFLVQDDVPSMYMKIQIDDSRSVRLYLLHPRPPAPGENSSSIERDVELLVLAKTLQSIDDPVVVSGDLNDVAWSRTTRLFRRVSGLLDIRVGRGMFNTFNAKYPFLRWPLDHIFVSSHFRVVKIKRLDHIGSDHFPVLATLGIGKPIPDNSHLELEDADEELIEETLQSDAAKEAKSPSFN